MINSPLEYLARKYENVVRFDSAGEVIGIFVKFPKMKSSDLVSSLPEHTHPAFIIDDIEQDYILLGKYKACENGIEDGTTVSLPNLDAVSGATADRCLERMRASGSGITGMTAADYGFIKLLAQKEGWNPNGNTDFGHSHKDARSWAAGETIYSGNERAYRGWLFECLKTHNSAAENAPGTAPGYWKRTTYIGGFCKDGTGTRSGSGPLAWYLGEDIGNLTDIIGSCMEIQYGYRIYGLELQVLKNNNAADPDADLSEGSSAWKAILPNPTDNGYTLVAPGTSGTLHWNWLNGKITLDTAIAEGTISAGTKSQKFTALAVNNENLPYVPTIIYELGLLPTGSGDKTEGTCSIDFSSGELLSVRGGSYNDGDLSGLGRICSTISRNDESAFLGCRPRAI